MDEAYLAVGTIAREGSFQGGKGMWAEVGLLRIWWKLGGLWKLTLGM